MAWQAYIAVCTVLLALRILTTRIIATKAKSKNASLAINAGVMTVVYACVLVYAAFHHVETQNVSQYWLNFLLGGACFGISYAAGFKLYSYVESAIGTVIGTATVLFTCMFAAVFLHERFTTLQIIGSLILIPSICYIVLLNRTKSKVRFTGQVVTMGLLNTAFLGAGLVNEKYLLGHMSIATYVVFGIGGQVLMSWVIALYKPAKITVLFDKNIRHWILIAGAVTAAAGLTFIEAQVKSDNVALVNAISSSRLVIVVLLAALFLHERKFLGQKIAVSLVAALGVMLMVF